MQNEPTSQIPQALEPQQTPAVPPVADRNGLAIASMVLGILSIVFVWFLGFILGILAIIFGGLSVRRTTKRGLAITGLVTGIVALVLSLGIFLFAIVSVTYSGIQERAEETSRQTDAATVQKKAEAFSADTGAYPSFQEMEAELSSSDIMISAGVIGTPEDNIIYQPCGSDGARIAYWSTENEDYESTRIGDTSACE